MMDVGEFWNVHIRIRYKPGWKLVAQANSDTGLGHIRWKMLVPDANDPKGEPIEFHSAWVTKPLDAWDEEGVVREAYRLAVRAEIHEAGEFFTYKDTRPFDPHRSVIEEGARYG